MVNISFNQQTSLGGLKRNPNYVPPKKDEPEDIVTDNSRPRGPQKEYIPHDNDKNQGPNDTGGKNFLG